jgi:hypothetical protein
VKTSEVSLKSAMTHENLKERDIGEKATYNKVYEK